MNRYALLMLLPLALAACGGEKPVEKKAAEPTAAARDYERGPHRGRTPPAGDFALEGTAYENNKPPPFL
ncbi:HlyD family secretion protein, partial [Pseudomonas aeruginosa]|nr:HlyD family secretion protein [Pseudomonas aeruginosa]